MGLIVLIGVCIGGFKDYFSPLLRLFRQLTVFEIICRQHCSQWCIGRGLSQYEQDLLVRSVLILNLTIKAPNRILLYVLKVSSLITGAMGISMYLGPGMVRVTSVPSLPEFIFKAPLIILLRLYIL